MTDHLKQFLDVQVTVAKLLAQQTETLIKEGSNIVQQAVSTAGDMHNSGIEFIREVMEAKKLDGAQNPTNASSGSDSTAGKSKETTNSSANAFENDRRGFSD
jgi:hypothetical protein